MHSLDNEKGKAGIHNLASSVTPELKKARIIACIISIFLHPVAFFFFFKLYTTIQTILSYQSAKSLPVMRVSIVKNPYLEKPSINEPAKKQDNPAVVEKTVKSDEKKKKPTLKSRKNKTETKIVTNSHDRFDSGNNAYSSGENFNSVSDTPYEYAVNKPPVYPEIARENGFEGLVLLEVLVSEKGKSINVRVIKTSGYDILDIAAMRAVNDWEFIPASKNGTPVRGKVRIPISFELSD